MLADMGCRNTVFDASAQSGLPHLAGLVGAGYGTLRVELVDEPAAYVAPLLEGYRAALQAVVQGGGGSGAGSQQHAQVRAPLVVEEEGGGLVSWDMSAAQWA